ncbi:hypothetical protein N7541_003934 [Penicillium brevicompactum]|uniref:Uncharacterized protein n=1 Tax=Penicillium brevicompactum TaxID=5074 RepID=A0A9W9RP39_PENBR|nr:hypothetical protein N7541_003934 [Penicillium brevicompactum]
MAIDPENGDTGYIGFEYKDHHVESSIPIATNLEAVMRDSGVKLIVLPPHTASAWSYWSSAEVRAYKHLV